MTSINNFISNKYSRNHNLKKISYKVILNKIKKEKKAEDQFETLIYLPDNKNNRQDIITFKKLKSGDKVIRLANHKFIKQSTLKNLIKSQWNKNYSIKQLYSLRNKNRLFKIHPLRKNNKRETIEFIKFKQYLKKKILK